MYYYGTTLSGERVVVQTTELTGTPQGSGVIFHARPILYIAACVEVYARAPLCMTCVDRSTGTRKQAPARGGTGLSQGHLDPRVS